MGDFVANILVSAYYPMESMANFMWLISCSLTDFFSDVSKTIGNVRRLHCYSFFTSLF